MFGSWETWGRPDRHLIKPPKKLGPAPMAQFIYDLKIISLLVGAVGDLQSAWARNQQALTIFWSGRYPAMRGYNLYYGRYEFARSMKQPHLQMSAWLSGLALSESFDDNVLRAMAHSLMASAAVAAEQPGIAAKEFTLASQLFSAAPQIDSTRIDRMEVETRLAEVEATHGAAQQAVLRLQQLEPKISQLSDNFLAILFYTTLEKRNLPSEKTRKQNRP